MIFDNFEIALVLLRQFLLKLFQTAAVEILHWQCRQIQRSTLDMSLELLYDDLPYIDTSKF